MKPKLSHNAAKGLVVILMLAALAIFFLSLVLDMARALAK